GGRVAEAPCHLLDRLAHRLAPLPRGRRARLSGQGPPGAHAAGPGAEILGREVASRRLGQVGIDVARADRAPAAALVPVLEQVLAGQLLAPLHDPAQLAVLDPELVDLSRFPAEVEVD